MDLTGGAAAMSAGWPAAAPGIAALVALVLVVIVLALVEPWLTRAAGLHRTPPSRIPAMDGLRGLAALAVVVHHGVTMRSYLGTGEWAASGHLAEQLGSLPVALFFMISAYLFVGGLVRAKGRSDSVRLFDGRIMRIAPLYAVAIALLCLFVAIETDFTLTEPAARVAGEVGHWSLFGFTQRGPINGFAPTFTLMSQIWTLRYEWLLYALIPVMALGWRLAGRRAGRAVPYLVLGVATVLSPMFAFFVAGTLVAEAAGHVPPRARTALDVAGIACLVATVVLFFRANGVAVAVLLGVTFLAAIEGRRLPAALSGRALRALGTVSYSLYLIHTFPLWIASHWLLAPADFARLDFAGMVAVDAGVALASIAVAIVTYRLIEAPLMKRRLFARRAVPDFPTTAPSR